MRKDDHLVFLPFPTLPSGAGNTQSFGGMNGFAGVIVKKGKHTLKIKALDDHIILDQWMIDYKKDRKFYVIPANQ